MRRIIAMLGAAALVTLAATSCSSQEAPASASRDARLPGVACNGATTPYAQLTANGCNLASCSDYPNQPNGCGPAQGLPARVAAQIAQGPFPFTSCCNAHDIAYGTCNGPAFGAGKTGADNALSTCMQNLCNDSYPGPNLPGAAKVWKSCCKKAAALIFNAVNLGGQSAYESAQSNACTCAGPADAAADGVASVRSTDLGAQSFGSASGGAADASAVDDGAAPAEGGSTADASGADGGDDVACPCDGPVDVNDPDAIASAIGALTSCPTSVGWYKDNPLPDAGAP